jgi:hypothetical protein
MRSKAGLLTSELMRIVEVVSCARPVGASERALENATILQIAVEGERR